MRKTQILIADDSPTIRNALKLLLNEREQFAVCGEAVDGEDAVDKAQSLNPDVVLLDLAMPKMNGAEAACILRKSNPHALLILFTMYGDSIGHDLAAAVGVDRVIAKSGGIAELIRCIEGFSEQTPDTAVH